MPPERRACPRVRVPPRWPLLTRSIPSPSGARRATLSDSRVTSHNSTCSCLALDCALCGVPAGAAGTCVNLNEINTVYCKYDRSDSKTHINKRKQKAKVRSGAGSGSESQRNMNEYERGGSVEKSEKEKIYRCYLGELCLFRSRFGSLGDGGFQLQL